MTKFICLTEICGNDSVKPLIINTSHIQHIQLGNKGKDIHVRMSDKTFFFVKESLVEIKKLIAEVPKPLQPVLMTAQEYQKHMKDINRQQEDERHRYQHQLEREL